MKKALFLLTVGIFALQSSAAFASDFTSVRDGKPSAPRGAVGLSDADIAATQAFTFNEFANFIRDWRKYKHWINEGKNRYKAVAYLGVAPSSDYPPEIVRWCDEHGWAVDRFFLLERKMRSGLTAAQQEEKRTVMVKQLKAQIAGLKQNKTMQAEQRAEREKELYAQMQKVMNATVYKAPISPAEFEMIKFNKTAVESTMRD